VDLTDVEVELQFTPTKTATPAIHEIVERAFADAGVHIARWTVPWGEDLGHVEALGMTWAHPSLYVRLVSTTPDDDYRTGMLTAALGLPLVRAIAAIGRAAPELPVTIEERVGHAKHFLSYGRDDEVRMKLALALLPEAGLGPGHAWIWRDDRDRWCEVVVAPRSSLHDPLRVELRGDGGE
jgi:hypothetical protein